MKQFVFILFLALSTSGLQAQKVRRPVDSVGFATRSWQTDSVMDRIFTHQGRKILDSWKRNRIEKYSSWKAAICPHDDYCYAGWLYPAVLRNIKAPVVLLIGVAHKAKKFGMENQIVFDSFDEWAGPYATARVSILRGKIMNKLPRSAYRVHDSLHQAEHSLEALLPVLQYYNRKVEIIPVLVPYMSFSRMDELSSALSLAMTTVMQELSLEWGRDIAIVISSDAVHYGDEDWGGQDYAPFGCDSAGYRQALAHEYEIIAGCLTGELSKSKLRKFSEFTVQDTNFRNYKWPWCGRYSVPFGLLTALHLEQNLRSAPVRGILLGYGNSIMQPAIHVEDLGMGKTAGASLRHWVGYASIGYR